MTKLLWGLALIALLSLGWGVWRGWGGESPETQRLSVQYDTVRVRDTALTDSLARRLQKASRSLQNALGTIDRLRGSVDSLKALPEPSTVDSQVPYWRTRALVAEGVVDSLTLGPTSLKAQAEAQMAETQASFAGVVASKDEALRAADVLIASLRRDACPKIPILGIPLPKVGIGYGMTPKGLAPVVAVVVPLGCG